MSVAVGKSGIRVFWGEGPISVYSGEYFFDAAITVSSMRSVNALPTKSIVAGGSVISRKVDAVGFVIWVLLKLTTVP